MAPNGELLVDDYPYAQDGLLIWSALEKYFSEYLSLYYKSDADVAGDTELQVGLAYHSKHKQTLLLCLELRHAHELNAHRLHKLEKHHVCSCSWSVCVGTWC